MEELDICEDMARLSLDDEKEEGEVLECHARIISFFAHKGGVSKTTNVHHLAYMLASQFHYKVLMIDADPQQNLTQTVCRQAKHDAQWRDGVERGDIYTALRDLHHGQKDGDYIAPANCVRLHNKMEGGELWLLPGSLNLAKLEPQITFAHNISNPEIFPLFDDIAGGFRALFLSTSANYDIDFCLVDMGPSIGELNKSLFWASDYFLIPCSPDAYCKTTMKTMEVTLPKWWKEQERLARVTAHMTMPVNTEPPQFLGILMGLFQVSGKLKKPIKDSQHWMDIVKQTVVQDLVPALREVGMAHEFCTEDFTLAEIPHFLSLMPIAQRSHCPVYDIPQEGFCIQNEHGETTPMSNSDIKRHQERGQYFFEKYQCLATAILDILAAECGEEEA